MDVDALRTGLHAAAPMRPANSHVKVSVHTVQSTVSVTTPVNSYQKPQEFRDCGTATGADSKIARQEQGESTWDPLNASELAPNSANGLIPSLIAWAKSQPPGNVAIVSEFLVFGIHAHDGVGSLHESGAVVGDDLKLAIAMNVASQRQRLASLATPQAMAF